MEKHLGSIQEVRAKATDHALATGGCTEVKASCQRVAPIAVIIPAYNYGRFLPFALDSILAQTVRPAEVLVVDDGSTDDTREVCRRYPGVRYAWKPNGGLCSARNMGLRLTTAPFVMFLDPDDLLKCHALETLWAAWRYLGQDVGTVFARSELLWEVDSPDRLKVHEVPDPHDVARYISHRFTPSLALLDKRIVYRLLRGSILPVCSTLVRREVFMHCGCFDEAIRTMEDYEIWLRVASRYRFAYIDDRVAVYRKHDAGFTSSANWVKNHRSILYVLQKTYRSRWANCDLRHLAWRYFSGTAYHLGSRLIDNHQWTEAAGALWLSVRHDPCRLKSWLKLGLCLARVGQARLRAALSR